MAKMELKFEFEIDDEMLKEHGLTAEYVAENLELRNSEDIDGFEITTELPGFNNLSDFFLKCGGVYSVHAPGEKPLIEAHKDYLDYISMRILNDMKNKLLDVGIYNFDKDEIKELANKITEDIYVKDEKVFNYTTAVEWDEIDKALVPVMNEYWKEHSFDESHNRDKAFLPEDREDNDDDKPPVSPRCMELNDNDYIITPESLLEHQFGIIVSGAFKNGHFDLEWSTQKAGGDCCYSIDFEPNNFESFTRAMQELYDSYELSDEVKLWLNSRAEGVSDIEDLIEDRKEVKQTLKEIADACWKQNRLREQAENTSICEHDDRNAIASEIANNKHESGLSERGER